jgi:hypothetical protein
MSVGWPPISRAIPAQLSEEGQGELEAVCALERISRGRGGVTGDSTPGLLPEEAWSPDAYARRSCFKGSQKPVRPHGSAEEAILGYKGRLRLLRGPLVDVAGLRRRQRRSSCQRTPQNTARTARIRS